MRRNNSRLMRTRRVGVGWTPAALNPNVGRGVEGNDVDQGSDDGRAAQEQAAKVGPDFLVPTGPDGGQRGRQALSQEALLDAPRHLLPEAEIALDVVRDLVMAGAERPGIDEAMVRQLHDGEGVGPPSQSGQGYAAAVGHRGRTR